ncbi:MAG TPA: RNase H family protein, partial [Nitrosopumilaceae archaeon]|nr:RNase H family protein [Nitrosopumilaceae archaeon]
DGSSLGNPGPGGAAAVYYPDYNKDEYESIKTGSKQTTNNMMELTAFECGIQLLKRLFPQDSGKEWIFLTDSQYTVNQIEEREGGPKNRELITRLIALKKETQATLSLKSIELYHVPGHTKKIKGNEKADELSKNEATRQQKQTNPVKESNTKRRRIESDDEKKPIIKTNAYQPIYIRVWKNQEPTRLILEYRPILKQKDADQTEQEKQALNEIQELASKTKYRLMENVCNLFYQEGTDLLNQWFFEIERSVCTDLDSILKQNLWFPLKK